MPEERRLNDACTQGYTSEDLSRGIVTEINESIEIVYNQLEGINTKINDIMNKLGLYGLPEEDHQKQDGGLYCGLPYVLMSSNNNKYLARKINDLLIHIHGQL